MPIRISTKPNVFWSRAVGVLVVLFPLSLSKIDFRNSLHGGLNVSTNRASPAYAAFEDLSANFDTEEIQIPEHGFRLAAGTKVNDQLAQPQVRQRLVVMRGMTVRAPAELLPSEPSAPTVKQPIYIATNLTIEPVVAKPVRETGLTIRRPQESLAAKPMAPEDFAAITPAQRAQELVERELQAAGLKNNSSLLAAYYPKAIEKPVKEEEPTQSSLSTFIPSGEINRPLWLNGQIEMTGGLAFVGPETHIEVKRVLNGETVERGRVWVTEGKFEIHVKKAIGHLVAELQTRDGRVLGRGEMNLVALTDIVRKENKVNDIRLALRPTAYGAAFRPISGYSHGQQKMPIADARVEIQSYSEPQGVNEDGLVIEPSLTRQSSFVARGLAKKHWPSIVVGQAQHPQDVRLFSNSLVEALINLDQPDQFTRREAALESIVWGQVARNGQPVAGAQVEMAGNYRAIYFNEMFLPDRSMTRTGANGLFAFLKVKTGVQAIRIKAFGRMYPAQIFPTEEKHVSYMELEIRDKVVSQFRVFDVLDMRKPVSARIRLVGTESQLALNKNQYVEYSVASDHFMIEAEAGAEYETARMTLTGVPHLVNVPLVRRDWIYQMYVAKNISAIPGRGAIVGFIDDQDFEVELTGYAPQEQMQILYFDAEGKPVESKAGIAGGGFIIFNAPVGLQTVYIHPTQSRETYSEVVVAEPQYVHVIAWSAAGKR